MCLYANPKAIARLKRQLNKSGKIVAWKLLRRVHDGEPSAITLRSEFMYFDWRPGWNVSDRKPEDEWLERETCQNYLLVHHGIHVFLDKPDPTGLDSIVAGWTMEAVPVTCHLRDFVAADRSDAVFRKVYLRKRDYEAAMAKTPQ